MTGEEELIAKEKYFYDELTENAKINAILKINQMIRAKLSLSAGAEIVDIPFIVCIISMLGSVFDKNGNPKSYSKEYKVVTAELIKELYDQCSSKIFRKEWAVKWIRGDLESFFNDKISFIIINGELKTAVSLGVSKKDFKTVMGNLSSYKESERFYYILKILDLENMEN